jgi:hypothetical protein
MGRIGDKYKEKPQTWLKAVVRQRLSRLGTAAGWRSVARCAVGGDEIIIWEEGAMPAVVLDHEEQHQEAGSLGP